MTAINVYRMRDPATGLSNVAYVFGDGASYDINGIVNGITGKVHAMPSISTALAFSGRSVISCYLTYLLEREAESFDHLCEILPERLESMQDELTAKFGVDINPSAKGQQQGYRMFGAGWSDARQTMVAFSISSVDEGDVRKAFTVHESPGGFQAPGVSNEQCELGFGGSPVITPNNIEDVALTMVELQRQEPNEDGQFTVGGLVEFVEVRRDSIKSRILKRWPEDQIGECLTPSPVDWAAWRATRTVESGAGLSRVKRKMLARKARKAA